MKYTNKIRLGIMFVMKSYKKSRKLLSHGIRKIHINLPTKDSYCKKRRSNPYCEMFIQEIKRLLKGKIFNASDAQIRLCLMLRQPLKHGRSVYAMCRKKKKISNCESLSKEQEIVYQ